MAVLLYLGLMLAGCALAHRLMFPGQSSQGRPEARVAAANGLAVERLTTPRGDEVALLFFDGRPGVPDTQQVPDRQQVPDTQRVPVPTVLFFYGNGSKAADTVWVARELQARGLSVVVLEYPGYGMSGGSPSEASIDAAALAAYDHVAAKPGVAAIVPLGVSLGGAVAAEVAAERPVAGLVTMSTFTSMDAMGRRLVPVLPMSLVLPSHFRSDEQVARAAADGVPMFILHGDRDTLIPHAMSDELAAIALEHGAAVTRRTVAGAGHNDLFQIAGDGLWDEVADWVGAVAGAGARP